MRLLDLFCGRWGWSRAFAARGWECIGVDLVEPTEIPDGCSFLRKDILDVAFLTIRSASNCADTEDGFDFIVASSPCEQFSVHGMKHFHHDPPYPELGIKLFNHTRELCEASGRAYVMENVRSAQKFVGDAVHHCGPFYLWGNAVPPIMPQGILKGRRLGIGGYRTQKGKNLKLAAAEVATIPPELANCVADYAERLLEQRRAG